MNQNAKPIDSQIQISSGIVENPPSAPRTSGQFRFTISQLLLTMFGLACALAFFSKAPFLVVTLSFIFLAATFGFGKNKQRRSLLALFTILIPLEFCSGILAYHTLGEIDSWIYRFMLLCNVGFLIAFILGYRRTAFVATVLLAALIIPYQTYLGIRWRFIHAEAVEIVNFVTQTQKEIGSYPTDLDNYSFRYPSVQRNIAFRVENNSFQVFYTIGTKHTSHWYDDGRWNYYPD